MSSRNRIIISISLAVLFIGGALFATRDNTLANQKVAGTNSEGVITEKDLDNDGLMDWEERLWKTNENNADTDGDGTNDGDEVKEGRSPVIAGPNDDLSEAVLANRQGIKVFVEDKNLNLSTSFGRSVLATYADSKSLDSESIEAMDALLSEKLPSSKNYILSDLNIGNAISKESYRSYGNSLATILATDAKDVESELTIFAKAVQNKDKDALAGLDSIVEKLDLRADLLLSLSVPYTAADNHLALINSIEAAKYDISGMTLVFDDPMLAFLALNSYRATSDKVIKDLESLKQTVKSSGAIFVNPEPGFEFFK